MLKWTILAGILIFSLNTLGAEKLYKWVDEEGRTHYSDKPPLENDAQLQTIGAESVVEQATDSTAIINKANANPIWFVMDDQYFSPQFLQKYKIGSYRFGKDCVSPTAILLDNIREDSKHKSFIPNRPTVTSSILESVRSLNYEIRNAMKSDIDSSLKHLGGLVLYLWLDDIDLAACVESPGENHYKGRVKTGYDPLKFHYSAFKKQQVWVSVKWELRDSSNKRVLFTGTTQGSINQWTTGKNANYTVAKAIGKATSNLFSNKDFVSLVQNLPAKVEKQPIAQTEEKSIFDSLPFFSEDNSYIKKAKFAKALSYSSVVKTMVAEYYASEGYWPTNEELHRKLIDGMALNDSGIVDIKIYENNAIFFELEKDVFGENAYFELKTASENSGVMIHWRCFSNLDKAILNQTQCFSH